MAKKKKKKQQKKRVNVHDRNICTEISFDYSYCFPNIVSELISLVTRFEEMSLTFEPESAIFQPQRKLHATKIPVSEISQIQLFPARIDEDAAAGRDRGVMVVAVVVVGGEM